MTETTKDAPAHKITGGAPAHKTTEEAPATKKKRKAISLDIKIQILDRLANGQGATSVGKHFGIHEATIRTIKKNEEAIRKSVLSGTRLSAKSSSYTRDIIKEKMEKALVVWINDKKQQSIPIDGKVIKQTALTIYRQIKEFHLSTSPQSNKNYEFSASSGWLSGFLKRHALRNAKMECETECANEPVVEEFPQKLSRMIKEEGYTPDQVWKVDQSNLFWRRMPTRSYVAKSAHATGGFKAANDRVTLLFCSNASGDRLLKPLVVNRALKATSINDIDFNKLPVHWMANKRASVTTNVFTVWFEKCFVPEVKLYLEDKGLEFKVLLILENSPGHPALEHPNVQFWFQPSNMATSGQPLPQSINTIFKTHYIKRTFEFVLYKINYERLTPTEVWKKFSIMDCINLIGIALSELTPSILNASWKVVWPDCVESKDPSITTTEFPDIITLAHKIGGEGFDDLSFADIEELLSDKTLSENEMLEVVLETPDTKWRANEEDTFVNLDLIKEGLDLAYKLGNHFAKHDPDGIRAGMFQRDLTSLMAPYRDLYKSIAIARTQRLITNLAVRTAESSAAAAASQGTNSNFIPEITGRVSIKQEKDDFQEISCTPVQMITERLSPKIEQDDDYVISSDRSDNEVLYKWKRLKAKDDNDND